MKKLILFFTVSVFISGTVSATTYYRCWVKLDGGFHGWITSESPCATVAPRGPDKEQGKVLGGGRTTDIIKKSNDKVLTTQRTK